MFYVSFIVIKKHKPTVDTQKIRESKHTTKGSHQITKEEQKQGKRNRGTTE